MKKILKVLGIILLVLLVLIIALVIVLRIFAGKNNRVMQETIDKGLGLMREHYTVTELDAGEFEDMRFYGIMKFHVDQYEVKELGNLSVMTADMGFMQMVSFMITPFEKDLPLCTLDYMYILNNRKSYVEFYDLVGNPDTAEYRGVQTALRDMTARYADFEEIPAEPHWYDTYLNVVMHKKLSKDAEARNQDMFCDALRTYLDASDALDAGTADARQHQWVNTLTYSNGLIEKGGVSTDVFKKALGEEKTRAFFNGVFFGTYNYKDSFQQ